MAGKVLEIQDLLDRNGLAAQISRVYDDWQTQRSEWLAEKKELREFIFATDTTKTTNSKLPWKNKTRIPKLTQIRDNLHANYMSALFPNDEWLRWEGYNEAAEVKTKKQAITTYMQNKLRLSGFRETVSQLLYDYIDYGNVIADVEFIKEYKEDPVTKEMVPQYIGPKAVRLSPIDIVFNPMAADFNSSPKITRYIKTIGELKMEAQTRPELGYNAEVISKAEQVRKRSMTYTPADMQKAAGFHVDGFGNLQSYYQSGYVEILEFEGDIHDEYSGEFQRNRLITIIDRSYVVRNEPSPSWISGSTKVHTGWRKRPDTLWAQGPLDNLIGMQYRIDHLENLKADVFDLIAHPPLKIRGNVEEFEWAPGAEIYLGDDGDVDQLRPDVTALNADMQIQTLEQKMEEFAGSPRETMGIRSPGEKTAFEVQQLITAAGRIFQEKITQFETEVLEPMLNRMLESARRNMDASDIIRVMDDDVGVVEFITITKDDITAEGKLYPVGARHFTAQAQLVQNLLGIFNSPVQQYIAPHVSGKKLTKMLEDVMNLGRFELFQENANIFEQMETQRLVNQGQEDLSAEQQTPLLAGG